MHRPLKLYPEWFRAAGFVYICPQHVATRLMERDGLERSGYISALPRYDAEARKVARDIVKGCHAQRRHYVYLDADSVPGTFDEAQALEGTPGSVTICRNDPPVDGSNVKVILPKSPLTS